MAETNQIKCPNCGQSYAVRPDQWAQYNGRTINCTKCAQSFTVTAPPEALTSPPAPAMPAMTPSFGSPPPHMPPAMGYAGPGTYADPSQMYTPQPKGRNAWAIVSLVSGIVLFCLPILGGVTAVVTGIIGLVRTRDPRVGGKGPAIAGISLGGLSLACTPIVLVMVSVMLPALNRAREQANRVKCASNMRQLGTAMAMYANANGGHYPDKLEDLLQVDPSMARTVFICPDDDKSPPSTASAQTAAHDISAGHCSYIYVGNELTTSASPDTVVLFEPLTLHHKDGMNVMFADGHIEWTPAAEAKSILAQEAAGTRPIKTGGP